MKIPRQPERRSPYADNAVKAVLEWYALNYEHTE
jgi:hypothetical protein